MDNSQKTYLHPVIYILFFMGIIVNLTLDSDLGKEIVTDSSFRTLLKALALFCAAIPALYSAERSEKRHRNSTIERKSREAQDELKNLLTAAVGRLFQDENPINIRANIMVEEGDKLEIFCAFDSMKLFPDHDVSFRIGEGCAGKAWKRAIEKPMSERWTPVVSPNTQIDSTELVTEWNLTPGQVNKTTDVLWVMSTPIFCTRGGTAHFTGVLNFDGVGDYLNDMSRLTDTKFHGICAGVADRLGDELVKSGLVSLPTGN